MAGEFDPLGGDLYSIMGGIPGGGPVGALAAGQMQGANLQEKLAQAEQMRQQAAFQQAQAQRTQALTQPEVQQTLGLAGLYGGQTQRLGAETQGLNLANIARGANLPGEVGATGAKFAAEVPQAQRSAFEAKASISLPWAPDFKSIPSDSMRENAIDTFGAQAGLSKDPNWAVIKDAFMKGSTGQQALGQYYALSPKIAEEETKGQFGLKETQMRTEAEKYTADARKAVGMAQAQAKTEAASFKDPNAGYQYATQKAQEALQSGNVDLAKAYQDQANFAQEKWKFAQDQKQDLAKALLQSHMITPEVAQMIAGQTPTMPSAAPSGKLGPTPQVVAPTQSNQPAPPQPNTQAPEPEAFNKATGQTLVLRNGQWVPK